ncbi:LppX_LprAFG lipoprotein [Actinomadura sp. ATCC 31491]|uniref:LppX_LprAFG lipoprotein n=1 Tax=Actinomadura luzonensis TaxID=2805427 RepID=A0ABT0FT43_9ACTN|nr:LppX_LprAFG lipoprotein [Actinomadura luzonensis]MCK2215068.1 LppX_LprAFG lipoprotein [Actinomadura luzonensis]
MLKRTISLAAAGAALVVAAVAGCGTNAQPIQVNLAASEVLAQAAQKTAEVTSYTVDAVLNATDTQEGSGRVQGRMLYQSKPDLAVDLTLDTVDMGGKSLPGGVRAVLQGDTVYVKVEALNKMLGATKPWIKVSLDQVGDRSQVDQYLAQIQQFDLANVTKLVTASKDVKSVGNESVNGDDTTHYSGSFPVDAAVLLLPADKQSLARTSLAELKDVKFDIWVASDGLPRKLALNGQKEGDKLDATLFFKDFNKPVTIQAPPADQVGDLPQAQGTTN